MSVRKHIKRRDDGKPKLLNTTGNEDWVGNHQVLILDEEYLRSLGTLVDDYLLSAEVLYHRFGKTFVKNSYDVTDASKHYHVAMRFRRTRRKLIDKITAEWRKGEQFAISQVDILAKEYLGIGRKVQKDWDWFLK